MHRHVKLFALACLLVAAVFVTSRYVMIEDVAQYDASHP